MYFEHEYYTKLYVYDCKAPGHSHTHIYVHTGCRMSKGQLIKFGESFHCIVFILGNFRLVLRPVGNIFTRRNVSTSYNLSSLGKIPHKHRFSLLSILTAGYMLFAFLASTSTHRPPKSYTKSYNLSFRQV